MNPNRLTRELRKIPGNIRSPHLPGGTLVSAVLDRRLMAWSDRGGASRIFGDVWSDHCWQYIRDGGRLFAETNANGTVHVVRLDDNPKIAIQAGRHKLPNPDFLIVEHSSNNEIQVRAVDAKFAVDRLRRTQVSPESIRELFELPDSLARMQMDEQLDLDDEHELDYLPGMFLGPSSLLNDYFYEQITTGDDPQIPRSEIKLVPVPPASLFAAIDEYPLMEEMRMIDNLKAMSTGSNLVLEMYYLRLTSAARWFANQQWQPILSLDEPDPVPVEDVLAMTRAKIEQGVSAFGLIETWSQETEHSIQRRKQVQDAARLPLRMSEIRKVIHGVAADADKKSIRMLRGTLEKHFMRRLIEETGTIPADSSEPFARILDRVHATSRSLRLEMMSTAESLVQSVVAETPD